MASQPNTAACGELTKDDTTVVKGIALLLLLAHHLFYIDNGLYDEYTLFGTGIVQALGRFSKVCVALFVFLSGYGIMRSAGGKGFSVRRFYARGFTKLYLNYWFIWLLFVPAGIVLFGRSMEEAYGDKLWVRGLLDFFGFARSAGFDGYNITWWFYSCILLLYALTPLLYRTTGRYPLSTLAATILFLFLSSDNTPLVGPLHCYLFPFALGMVSARYELVSRAGTLLMRRRLLPPLLFIVISLLRTRSGLYLDGIWTFCFITVYSIYFKEGGGESGHDSKVASRDRAAQFQHLPLPYLYLLLFFHRLDLRPAESAARLRPAARRLHGPLGGHRETESAHTLLPAAKPPCRMAGGGRKLIREPIWTA